MCEFTHPTWSSDESYLVVSMQDETSQGALYKVFLDGSGREILLQSTGNFSDEIFHDPKLSPSGNQIAYVRWGPSMGDSQIWVMDTDGSNRQQLTSGETDYYPAWSPDGRYITFARMASGTGGIFLVGSDGTDEMQITSDRGGYPAWTD